MTGLMPPEHREEDLAHLKSTGLKEDEGEEEEEEVSGEILGGDGSCTEGSKED